jgi:hypothetical protein
MNKGMMQGKIEVTLGGRALTLAMDNNALCELEEVTGGNPHTAEFWNAYLSNLGPKRLRLLFWAMTRSYNPEITLLEMGGLISLENQDDLKQLFEKVQASSFGNENAKKNFSASAKVAPKLKKETTASTGSSSGPSPDTTSASQT